MRKRTGDWRDLLSAYSLAIDTKKIFVGFVATLCTVIVMIVAAMLYAWLSGTGLLTVGWDASARALVELGSPGILLTRFMQGTGLGLVTAFLPLLNPFYSGQPVHFILSVLFCAALFWVWSGAGGIIARLTALEYARGDLPTLDEAKAMVKSKRMSYFFAPLWPLIGIVLFTLMNVAGGLLGSIPYLGRLLLIFPGFPLLVASTIVIVFLAVFAVLGFGMMMPAISVGGKDAFEGWSSSFSYILWGFSRLFCYTLVAAVIGALAAVVAWALVELLIYGIYQTVNIGYMAAVPWIVYEPIEGGLGAGLLPAAKAEGTFALVCSSILIPFFLALRALSVAYVFAYFFSANTVIFLLMRKHVDNVEIDEIYEEAEEEEGELVAPAEREEAVTEEEEPTAEEVKTEEEPPAEAPAAEEEKPAKKQPTRKRSPRKRTTKKAEDEEKEQ